MIANIPFIASRASGLANNGALQFTTLRAGPKNNRTQRLAGGRRGDRLAAIRNSDYHRGYVE